MSAPGRGKVYVLLVNWNGWRDTVECLESVLAPGSVRREAVVCDNGSSDGSIERILGWAGGCAEWRLPASSPARRWQAAPVAKPVGCRLLGARDPVPPPRGDEPPVTLIAASENRGFSAGVNVCLRYALSRGDASYAWLLNNDAVVAPDALGAFVAAAPDPDEPVVCGGTIFDYEAPDRVQCFAGGTFQVIAGRPRLIGAGASAASPPPPASVESRLAYVSGASMFVTRGFLARAGLLDESYFLYFEELDWLRRAGTATRVRFVPEARIYHKLGASAGTGAPGRWPSAFAEYHFQRSRIRFVRRHHRLALPAVGSVMLLQAMRWLLRGERAHARAVGCALLARPFRSARGAEAAIG